MSDSIEQSTNSAAESTTAVQESAQQGVLVQVSRDEFNALLSQAVSDAAGNAASAVNDSVSEQLEGISADVSSLGTVALVPEQYDLIMDLGATGLHTQVVSVGLLSLLLGAVIATAVTLHWRGGRG